MKDSLRVKVKGLCDDCIFTIGNPTGSTGGNRTA
jgi:hypothetical protein